ncbi:MAG TPA: hypothetical protein VMU88_09620 [bacterium]|nr:hypothetical protein [bacterium]
MRIPFWILAAVLLASRVCAKDGFDVPLYDPATHRDILPSGEATVAPTATLPPAITATPGPSPASPPSALKTPAIPAAPQWAQVKTVPKDVLVNPKLSPWMSSLGIGVGIPAGAEFPKAYGLGFDLQLGSGYRLDDHWSLWLDFSLGQFGSRNDTLSQNNNFMMVEAALGLKYRLTDESFSPFLFAGPGLAYGENRSNQAVQYDPGTGSYDIPINRYEVDAVVEGGLGIDLRVADALHFYLQGRVVCDFISEDFAAYASKDSPLVLVPVELGILFGY